MRNLLVPLVMAALMPGSALGQQASSGPTARPPRADIAASIGWLNSEVSAFTGSEHNWTHSQATFGVHGGYYWTEHLKTDAVLERSSTATTWSYEQVPLPSGGMAFSGGTHDIEYTRVSVGQFYQFGHNAWVHAALGGGAAITRRHVMSQYRPFTYYDRTGEHISAAAKPDEDDSDTIVRGFVAAALKTYVTPRAFFRADVQGDFRTTLDHVAIRAGFGIDF